jgi:hypothetical protein
MLIVAGDGIRDDVLFHEFGHEAYYRRMLGEDKYNYYYRESTRALQTGVFPRCISCTTQQTYRKSSPEAAMIEGWATFFETMTTRVIEKVSSFGPELEPLWSGADGGSWVSGRVAATLWDFWDIPNTGVASSTDNDLVSPAGNAQVRYGKVANYFVNKDELSSFKTMWHQRIKPTLNVDALKNHCQVLKLNTLTATPGVEDIDSECKAKL